VRDDLARLLREQRGHFELESGHHGDLWLELESLCRRPSLLSPLAIELTGRLRPYAPEVICGPLVEGAFVGLLVAQRLDVEFIYSERQPNQEVRELFPVCYRIPATLRGLAGRRVAIVNDVINAGSAVRGTLTDLAACDANVIAIGSLLVLGSAAQTIAEGAQSPLETLAIEPNSIWKPSECPLCASGAPLVEHPELGG